VEAIINNLAGARIDSSLIKKLTARVSRKKMIVGVSFVKKSAIRKLNRVFRKKDKPTDVLSFNMNEGKYLGDVIICPEVAKANAKRYGSTLKAEMARLAVHGMLHLLGMDHGRKMFNIQDKIMEGIGYA